MEKIALITGASKGIGRELAIVFAKNHYSLLLIARNSFELQQLQKSLQDEFKCKVQILAVDLSLPNAVDTILSTFKDQLQNLEVLINNAGYGIAKKFSDMTYEDVTGMITVNMTALTTLTYRILPYMRANHSGKILNVASTAAYVPGPYMALYYASKAFVLSLSEALYEEYKKEGIHVSTLCPGITKTSFQARAGMENSLLVKGTLPAMTAAQVAEIAYQGLQKNKRVIVTGFFNKLSILLMSFTPRFLLLKIMAKLDRS